VSAGVKIATIGFTQTTAERFFKRLQNAGVKKIVDVRLHNTSQLAGFAKSEDLTYFLKVIGGITYVHAPLLAPTDIMLKAFKKEKGDWTVYENRFLALIKERRIEEQFNPDFLEDACLLCSEALPHRCHRRLVCDYLNEKWGGQLEVRHL
jgi:uncharacterized protein (DUF488 family)